MATDETDALRRIPDADTVELCCECGERLSFETSTSRIDRDCGASYAVTITQLMASTRGGGQ
jgi:hypothetical protein